jgi:hypothetical protein
LDREGVDDEVFRFLEEYEDLAQGDDFIDNEVEDF